MNATSPGCEAHQRCSAERPLGHPAEVGDLLAALDRDAVDVAEHLGGDLAGRDRRPSPRPAGPAPRRPGRSRSRSARCAHQPERQQVARRRADARPSAVASAHSRGGRPVAGAEVRGTSAGTRRTRLRRVAGRARRAAAPPGCVQPAASAGSPLVPKIIARWNAHVHAAGGVAAVLAEPEGPLVAARPPRRGGRAGTPTAAAPRRSSTPSSSGSTAGPGVQRGGPVAALVVRAGLGQVVEHAHRGYLRFGRYSRGRAGTGSAQAACALASLGPAGRALGDPAGDVLRVAAGAARAASRRTRTGRTGRRRTGRGRRRRRRGTRAASRPRRAPAGRSSRTPAGSRSPRRRWRTSTTVPSASSGSPSRTPSTRASLRTTPRSARSARLTRSIGPPWKRISRHLLAADRRTPGDTWRHAKSSTGKTTLHPPRLEPDRDLAAVAADQRGRAGRAPPRRRCRVPECEAPTTRTGPSRSWPGRRYSLECSCRIDGSRSFGELGDVRRPPEGAGRDHHVVAVHRPGVGGRRRTRRRRRPRATPVDAVRRAGPAARSGARRPRGSRRRRPCRGTTDGLPGNGMPGSPSYLAGE